MISNIWIDGKLKNIISAAMKRKRVDRIPATCDGKDGEVYISMKEEEIQQMLNLISRGVVVNSTGNKIAQIDGTSITIEVATIEAL